MRTVISDTSPIRYLVLIGLEERLGRLYGRVLVPDAVVAELQREQTPKMVHQWMQAPPSWVEVISTGHIFTDERADPSFRVALGAGEREVIRAAISLQADLMLMDERAGVEEARHLGLTVTGTLGVLARFAEAGWINLPEALERLQAKNFRAHPKLIQQMLQMDKRRP